MADIRGLATGSLAIDAPPSRVYSILADYNQHHPRVVPPEYFKALLVEEGGVGAGTRIHVIMTVMGTTQKLHHIVSEPEPGRILVETDTDGYSVTTFTVDPLDSGRGCRLTITTEFTPRRKGILGIVERYLTRRMLSRIYLKELALIAEYARDQELEIRPA